MAGEFLGVGWAFPIQVSRTGAHKLEGYAENIKQACRIILGTAPGERAMRPDFGCLAHDLLFEPADSEVLGKVEFYVANALTRWEPRIIVKQVAAKAAAGSILADIEYVIRQTNTEENLVYPFFNRALP